MTNTDLLIAMLRAKLENAGALARAYDLWAHEKTPEAKYALAEVRQRYGKPMTGEISLTSMDANLVESCDGESAGQASVIAVRTDYFGDDNPILLPNNYIEKFGLGFKFKLEASSIVSAGWNSSDPTRNYEVWNVDFDKDGRPERASIETEAWMLETEQKAQRSAERERAKRKTRAILEERGIAIEVGMFNTIVDSNAKRLLPHAMADLNAYIERIPKRFHSLIAPKILEGRELNLAVKDVGSELIEAVEKKAASLWKIKKNRTT